MPNLPSYITSTAANVYSISILKDSKKTVEYFKNFFISKGTNNFEIVWDQLNGEYDSSQSKEYIMQVKDLGIGNSPTASAVSSDKLKIIVS